MKRALGIWTRLPFAATILFTASFVCFATAASVYFSYTSTTTNTATFALRGTGISSEDAASIRAVADDRSLAAPFVFWSEKGYAETLGPNDMDELTEPNNLNEMNEPSDPSNPNDSTNPPLALAADPWYCGDIGLLLPDIPAGPVESGKYPPSNDASDDPANDIASNGTGNESISEPTTSGSTDGSASAVFGYDRLTTTRLDADGFPVTAETIESSMQVQCDELDYHLLSFTSYAALLLYPATLGIQTTLCCRRIREAYRHSALAQAFGYALPSIAAIAATATFAASLSEYGSYFPTRWSDFSAWGEAANSAVQGLAHVVFSAQTIIDEPIITAWAHTLVLAVASVMLAIAAKGHFELWSLRIEASHKESSTNRVGESWPSSN